MFDSPFEYCIACGTYVLLDQTRKQCAREHGCGSACPLAPFFTGIEIAAPAAHTDPKPVRQPPFDRSQGDRACTCIEWSLPHDAADTSLES